MGLGPARRILLAAQPEDAEEWNDALKMRDLTSSSKGKYQEAVLRFFDWRHHEYEDEQWEIDERERFESTGSDSEDTPDYLTKDERRKIREAVIDYCGDWERVSTVWSSLDCGFRPVEIQRAKDYWFREDDKCVIIPKEEVSKDASSKQKRELNDQAFQAVRNWREEREDASRYDDPDQMWLTKHGNPYTNKSLNRLMDNLAREAGLETRGRQMTRYAIRHSVGAYVTAARDLKAAKRQLGHENVESTLRYDKVAGDDTREVLDKIG